MAEPVLINGEWKQANASSTFQSFNPNTTEPLPCEFPVSNWSDCDEALSAAVSAASELRVLSGSQIAAFLRAFADRIEARADQLVAAAHQETALPKSPRLADVELPRTTNQLRLAAQAAEEGSWRQATIDTKAGIRSVYEAIGPVAVFGPNNFPFAFGSVSGGDFAAAIAAGNPVIGKANSSHPRTTQLFAEAALEAIQATDVPAATVQLIYRTSHADGEKLVADSRLGAVGYTGSRSAGLKLKAAADAVGKPIYLELSSVNPVVILPGALNERLDDLVDDFCTSGLMGAGQFCTNPGLLVLCQGAETDAFLQKVAERYESSAAGTLLSQGVQKALGQSVQTLQAAGAEAVVGLAKPESNRFACENTLLKVTADAFLAHPEQLQTEAFGNCSLVLIANDVSQVCQVVQHLEGNLTGCIYTATNGTDDAAYDQIAPALRQKVGRLLNDKMPTGVAVSMAMNHGGPFPATGHPGFTAVGIPASIHRFAVLACYDNVRNHRLPNDLQDKNPNGKMWRYVDGHWTTGNIG